MKKIIISFLVLFLLGFGANAQDAGSNGTKKVAIIISSNGEVGKENLSYDLEELAQAYLVLEENNIQSDIISPKGGAVLVPTKKDGLDFIQRFKKETTALEKLANTISADQAVSDQYDAVLVIGGAGAMFDLPVDTGTQKFISDFVVADKPIAAVCHGPAALVNISDANGQPFLKGKTVNSFTNLEEKAFGQDVIPLLPFLLEDKMKSLGAHYTYNLPMLPFVATDGNLVTAQNPPSVGTAVEVLLTKMGVKLADRPLFKDEATMALIAQARKSGPALIDVALAKKTAAYDLNYLALYGFYAYNLAQTPEDRKIELGLMQVISHHFSHPQYSVAMVHALMAEGNVDDAKLALSKLKAEFPSFEGLDSLNKQYPILVD